MFSFLFFKQVKDLENAMTKHLPPANMSSTDFSADGLLKSPSSTLPATALLRQLYSNRESVIRATTKTAPNSFYSGIDIQRHLPSPTVLLTSFFSNNRFERTWDIANATRQRPNIRPTILTAPAEDERSLQPDILVRHIPG
jgi:hypothetical protein